ncbi:MAG TPA: TIM barrel protein [Candidatus Cybelea sp.]
MKLACASSALGREIENGELTQLEFLDLCAHELACDGVVLDVRHFPRVDAEYLAQIKKMATDWGLTIAALSDASLFKAEGSYVERIFDYAVALGAPLIAAPLCSETECSWTQQLTRLGDATSLAKAANVTLALRNAPSTFANSTHDCKRVVKETDSAWLRYGPDPAALDGASDPHALAANTVLLWTRVRAGEPQTVAAAQAFAGFRGFVALDEPGEDADVRLAGTALREWRDTLCHAAKRNSTTDSVLPTR